MTILFHISDLHFGAEDRAALDWFARIVADEKPDGIICTGDLTMRGTAREFAMAAQWLAGLGAPVSLEPGNHDMPYYWELITRLRRPFARYEAFARHAHSELAVEGVALVSLPTVTPAQWRLNWSKGHVDQRLLAAALARLQAASHTRLRLVACHHPLVEADTQGTASTRGGKAALAALAAAGAHAVLTGHVHDPFDLAIEAGGRSIRMIGAGTLSERLRTTAPSFNVLTAVDGKLDVAVRRYGG